MTKKAPTTAIERQAAREAGRRQRREEALAQLIEAKIRVDAALARIKTASDDHFGADPEAVNFADVGSATHAAIILENLADQLHGTGEYQL